MKRIIIFMIPIIVIILAIVYFILNVIKTDNYVIAYVLESSEYNEVEDIYDLSLYVPSRDQIFERQMSGIYYREYDITNNQVCIDFMKHPNEEALFIVNIEYCDID